MFLDNRNNTWMWSSTELIMSARLSTFLRVPATYACKSALIVRGIQGFLCLVENVRCTYSLERDWLIEVSGFMAHKICVSLLLRTEKRECLTDYLNTRLSQAFSLPDFADYRNLGASAPSWDVEGLRPASFRQKQVEFTWETFSRDSCFNGTKYQTGGQTHTKSYYVLSMKPFNLKSTQRVRFNFPYRST